MKFILPFFIIIFYSQALSQSLKTYFLSNDENIIVDGILNEEVWGKVDSIYNLTMVEPTENSPSTFNTILKVASNDKMIYLGIICFDPEPIKITSYSKARDSELSSEDNIKFVFDTFRDGRSGYIFSVNPFGARYDALVSGFGESENPNWDGNWEASARINENSWSVEIAIPIYNFSFENGSNEWGFNFERKIQRLLEKDRWTGIKQDYNIGQVIHAGRLNNLPNFDLGIGLTTRVSAIGHINKSLNKPPEFEGDFSLDLNEKITSDITAQLTINTDFAETEVDSRVSNLTRFPVYFPEKRTFFLEGADIYDFGLGTSTSVVPFFSRRIGLYEGTEVPILFGGKLNGKLGNTNFGTLVTRMDDVDSLVPNSTLGVIRVKQNILDESSVGMIATYGDPNGDKNVWLAGVDFTYQTSKFNDDKNFLAGVWGIVNHNKNLQGDNSAFGLKIDYPNDLWDISFVIRRIGDAFSPSLGFVPRKGIISYSLGIDYMPRPNWNNIRQFFFESSFSLVTDLNHNWESYSIFSAPVHFLLESGDRFEFNIAPEGENLKEPFEISDGIIIEPDKYNWVRYRLELETASKRIVNGQATWWFGSFYNGTLDQIELELTWRPLNIFVLQFEIEKNIVKLPQGNFNQDLFGGRLQFNFSSDFQLSSLIQYDSESEALGTNTRLRWTFDLLGDLFIVYNHNINKIRQDILQFDSNQFIIKLTYGFWK
ncbi:MAG: carbohydrate binding family 9 domain-containing protein [Ignavibacterium sp.]|jgi:hypothetical protein|nr:carbohydrate binding family 9 domain-containing protein [Ignavibacterium sp.]